MKIDVYTATGQKKGTQDLPERLFGYQVNRTLIHQAILRQQGNARYAVAHAKNRSEVAGSTKKLYAQKHTGNARRGPSRSPLLRGGGKAFGPRNVTNFERDMPRAMRRAALRSCLSFQAKKGAIVGLESYPDTIKTKAVSEMITKMALKDARNVLFVLPEKHEALWLSCRNLPHVKAILVNYLNPVDVAHARAVVFVGDSIERAVVLFGGTSERTQKRKLEVVEPRTERKPLVKKKMTPKKSKAKPAAKATKADDESAEAPKKAKAAKKPSAKKAS